MVERLFLAVPCGCLWFVIVVFPDHTHLLFLTTGVLHISCGDYACLDSCFNYHVFLEIIIIDWCHIYVLEKRIELGLMGKIQEHRIPIKIYSL